MNTPYPPPFNPDLETYEQAWLDWLEEISWPPAEAEDYLPGGDGDSDDPPDTPGG